MHLGALGEPSTPVSLSHNLILDIPESLPGHTSGNLAAQGLLFGQDSP